MSITYTITQEEYNFFLDYLMEPGKLYRYPALYALAFLKLEDIKKIQSVISFPFTSADITIDDNKLINISIKK